MWTAVDAYDKSFFGTLEIELLPHRAV